MKSILIALVLVLPASSFAAKPAKAPKKPVCQGTYKSLYRTLEVDGKGNCYMSADGMNFQGKCPQGADGSANVTLGGNSFGGQWKEDCSELVMSGQTYKKD